MTDESASSETSSMTMCVTMTTINTNVQPKLCFYKQHELWHMMKQAKFRFQSGCCLIQEVKELM